LPAYNEGHSIGDLIDQARAVLDAETPRWSILVVDDGSRDDTAARVGDAATRDPRVRLVRHEVNRGLGPAILTGLAASLEAGSGPECMIVCMDADLTHPPATIPAMRRAMEAGADVVIASRFQPASRQVGVPPFRRLLSWGARHVFRHYLALPGVRDYTCGFRAFRAPLIARAFARFGRDGLITRRGFACTDELLVHLALLKPTIAEVPFTLRYDLKRGRSKMELGTTILETLKLVRSHRRLLRDHADRLTH
jgi:dolichol-phosphate mannosyltransferase